MATSANMGKKMQRLPLCATFVTCCRLAVVTTLFSALPVNPELQKLIFEGMLLHC
jgi:hypothetical protein